MLFKIIWFFIAFVWLVLTSDVAGRTTGSSDGVRQTCNAQKSLLDHSSRKFVRWLKGDPPVGKS